MELFAADGHDAGGCERVTGKSGMRPHILDTPRLSDADRVAMLGGNASGLFDIPVS